MQRVFKTAFLTIASVVFLVLLLRLVVAWNGERVRASAVERFSTEVLPLEIESFRRADVEEPENAAHFVRAGSLAMAMNADDVEAVKRLGGLENPLSTWSEEDLATARRLVEENRIARELFAHASTLDVDRSNFDLRWEHGAQMAIPNLLAILRGARLYLVDVRLAVAEGRVEDARRSAERMWPLAHTTYNEPIMIFDLIGLAIERYYWAAVQETFPGPGGADFLAASLERVAVVDLVEACRRATAAEGLLLRTATEADIASYADTQFNWWQRGLVMPFLNYKLAKVLDYYRRSLATYDTGTAAELLALPDVADSPSFLGSDALGVGLGSIFLKVKAAEAQRLLAETTLAMLETAEQDGAYPDAVPGAPTSPVDGDAVTWEPSADGGGVLTMPGEQLWSENLGQTTKIGPILSWRLPPPQG